jgi:hypothetical protein
MLAHAGQEYILQLLTGGCTRTESGLPDVEELSG